MGAFLLALIGMVFWGVAPIFGKLGLKRVDPTTGLYLRTLVAASLVVGWMMISGGFYSLQKVPVRSWFWITLEAICATLLGDLAYYGALKCGNTGAISVILAAAPILTVMLALFLFHERLNLPQMIGALLVVTGLIVMNMASCR